MISELDSESNQTSSNRNDNTSTSPSDSRNTQRWPSHVFSSKAMAKLQDRTETANNSLMLESLEAFKTKVKNIAEDGKLPIKKDPKKIATDAEKEENAKAHWMSVLRRRVNTRDGETSDTVAMYFPFWNEDFENELIKHKINICPSYGVVRFIGNDENGDLILPKALERFQRYTNGDLFLPKNLKRFQFYTSDLIKNFCHYVKERDLAFVILHESPYWKNTNTKKWTEKQTNDYRALERASQFLNKCNIQLQHRATKTKVCSIRIERVREFTFGSEMHLLLLESNEEKQETKGEEGEEGEEGEGEGEGEEDEDEDEDEEEEGVEEDEDIEAEDEDEEAEDEDEEGFMDGYKKPPLPELCPMPSCNGELSLSFGRRNQNLRTLPGPDRRWIVTCNTCETKHHACHFHCGYLDKILEGYTSSHIGRHERENHKSRNFKLSKANSEESKSQTTVVFDDNESSSSEESSSDGDDNESSSSEESSSDGSSASNSNQSSVWLDLAVQKSTNLKKSQTSVVNLRQNHAVHTLRKSPRLHERDTTSTEFDDIGVSNSDSSSSKSSDEDSKSESEMDFGTSTDLDFRQSDDRNNEVDFNLSTDLHILDEYALRDDILSEALFAMDAGVVDQTTE